MRYLCKDEIVGRAGGILYIHPSFRGVSFTKLRLKGNEFVLSARGDADFLQKTKRAMRSVMMMCVCVCARSVCVAFYHLLPWSFYSLS